jgi:ribonuclease Z
MPQVFLLGGGTSVPDVDRGYTHFVWTDVGYKPLLVDAGGDTYQRLLRVGIEPQELQGIVLTHSHLDHINGLPSLLFGLSLVGRREALPVYGLQSTLDLVQRIIHVFELGKYVVPVNWHVLEPGDTISLGNDRIVRTAPNDHSRPCLALRFEACSSGNALTYSGDTSPCQSVIDLAHGSHILLHEATVRTSMAGHSTPREAGKVATLAQVKHLVIVHYSPRWTMPEDEALASVRDSGFQGLAEIGQDYQTFSWP